MNEIERIQQKIYKLRGLRVMFDFDLAELYGVETRALNQAVKRNIARFPEDFMFRLTTEEWGDISSQFVTTSRMKRPKSALPMAFTEHGALMLSGVLHSDIAVDISIKIIRAFVELRNLAKYVSDNYEVLHKEINDIKIYIEEILEDQNDINEDHQAQLDAISIALSELQNDNNAFANRRLIGFRREENIK